MMITERKKGERRNLQRTWEEKILFSEKGGREKAYYFVARGRGIYSLAQENNNCNKTVPVTLKINKYIYIYIYFH